MNHGTVRLYELVWRVQSEAKGRNLFANITDICAACESTRTLYKRPFRFRVAMKTEEGVYNRELAEDLIWIAGNPVLHVVGTQTHLKNAIPIRSKRAEDVWNEFLGGWDSIYIGYPNVKRLGKEAYIR